MSSEEQNFELLQDLERQTPDEIRKQRAYERLAIKAKLILQSGNSSQLLEFKVQGVTGDISAGGCQAMFPISVNVGDVYRLMFDSSQIDLPLVFARCMRCKLVKEDAYEAGFAFFNRIKLPEVVAGRSNNDLL